MQVKYQQAEVLRVEENSPSNKCNKFCLAGIVLLRLLSNGKLFFLCISGGFFCCFFKQQSNSVSLGVYVANLLLKDLMSWHLWLILAQRGILLLSPWTIWKLCSLKLTCVNISKGEPLNLLILFFNINFSYAATDKTITQESSDSCWGLDYSRSNKVCLYTGSVCP